MTCPSCGHENPDHAKFCLECAQSVASGEPRPDTPTHLAEKILQSKSALEGERKQVSQETRIHVSVFLGLVAAIIVARALLSPSTGFAASVGFALGLAVIEIPAAIGIGLVVLWFADKLSLFVLNVIRPDEGEDAFSRTIWQTLSLSLVFVFPVWLLTSGYKP
jgi:hypothetical protein